MTIMLNSLKPLYFITISNLKHKKSIFKQNQEQYELAEEENLDEIGLEIIQKFLKTDVI